MFSIGKFVCRSVGGGLCRGLENLNLLASYNLHIDSEGQNLYTNCHNCYISSGGLRGPRNEYVRPFEELGAYFDR